MSLQLPTRAISISPFLHRRQPSLALQFRATNSSCAAVHLHSLPAPESTFYRRNLPPILTPFNSVEGRKLFKESLAKGTAEAFLHISGNLAHQSEPAFCGLGSLAIILNALEIDPHRLWKGPWRWYDENLLDCCSPLETIKKKGITFDEFASLASCNGLKVTAKRIIANSSSSSSSSSSSNSATSTVTVVSKNEFISDLLSVCSNPLGTTQLVVSFSRKGLQQTGDGHFSPVACFHAESGMVLVLDVARFKYPSYWVHVNVLYEAMKPVDCVTGKSRGYFLLSKRRDTSSLIEFPHSSRKRDSKEIIQSGLISLNGAVSCAHEQHVDLAKISVRSLSATEGVGSVLRSLSTKINQGRLFESKRLESLDSHEGDIQLKRSAIFQVLVSVLGNGIKEFSGTDDVGGAVSLSFRKNVVDLAHAESESELEAHQKAHSERIESLCLQLESLPIYKIIVDLQDSRDRYTLALETLLIVSIPGSIYLSLQNTELRTFLMETKYAIAQGPKSLLKNEMEKMELQLNQLMKQ